jgi:hypothetical protein
LPDVVNAMPRPIYMQFIAWFAKKGGEVIFAATMDNGRSILLLAQTPSGLST